MTAIVEQGLVSTIIPVFNRPALIVDAVNSVLEQTYRPIEIIIVDDGSTDNTPDVLRELAAAHSEVVILHQGNAGPGAARELGRKSARGEYIQYHDSDDLLLPTKFELQVTALQENSECDVAYGKTERIQLGDKLLGMPLKETDKKHRSMFPAFLNSRWWSTSTPLHRRSVVDQAGPWLAGVNEEDWEYDCRIASLGGRLVFVDEFVSVTRMHDSHLCSDGDTNQLKLKHRCQARLKIYEHAKHYMKLESRVSDIQEDDWEFYSKSAFLLARECALVGLKEYAETMIDLSLRATQDGGLQQKVFSAVAKIAGWRRTAQIAKAMGK